MHSARRILVLLAIGMVLNLAVAWTIAWWGDPTVHNEIPIEKIKSILHNRFGARLKLPPQWQFGGYSSGFGITVWSVQGNVDDRLFRLLAVSECATGWPLRTVSGFEIFDDGVSKFEWAIHVNPRFGPNRDGPGYEGHGLGRILPYRPLVPGLVVNTILYAAVVDLGFIMLVRRRRRSRLQKGRCPMCNYPLMDAATCPECGHEVPNDSRASPGA